jgi:hypothetical protein
MQIARWVSCMRHALLLHACEEQRSTKPETRGWFLACLSLSCWVLWSEEASNILAYAGEGHTTCYLHTLIIR